MPIKLQIICRDNEFFKGTNIWLLGHKEVPGKFVVYALARTGTQLSCPITDSTIEQPAGMAIL